MQTFDFSEEDDIRSLAESQSDTTLFHSDGGVSEDDMDLHLSPSQRAESVSRLNQSDVDGLSTATESVKLNVTRIQHILRTNQNVLVKQYDELEKLISDISVNVSDIDNRVRHLEVEFSGVKKDMNNNKKELIETQSTVQKLQKSIKVIKRNQRKTDNLEERIKSIEDKMRTQRSEEHTPATTVDVGENTDDCSIRIHNMPYGQKDNEDVCKLVRDGLGLSIRPKSIYRASSIYNKAGVVTVNLNSVQEKTQVMEKKQNLRTHQSYAYIYIENGNIPIQQRIHRKFHELMNNVHGNTIMQPWQRRHGDYPNRNTYRHSY